MDSVVLSAATLDIAHNEQSGIHADPHLQQFACEFRNGDAAQDGFRAIDSAAGMICVGDGNVEGGRRIGDGQTEWQDIEGDEGVFQAGSVQAGADEPEMKEPSPPNTAADAINSQTRSPVWVLSIHIVSSVTATKRLLIVGLRPTFTALRNVFSVASNSVLSRQKTYRNVPCLQSLGADRPCASRADHKNALCLRRTVLRKRSVL